MEKTAIQEPESRSAPDTESAGALILDCAVSSTVSNKCLFLSHQVCGIFIKQPEWTKAVC